MYAINQGNSTISIIDVATDTVVGLVNDPMSMLNDIYFMTITPDGSKAYVANYTPMSVSIINLSTNTVVGFISDPNNTLSDPFPIAITPDGRTAYVGNYNTNTISIVDVPTNTVTGLITYPFFNQIEYITITPDGKTGYVANFAMGMGVVSILDIATNTITGMIMVSGSSVYYPTLKPDGTKLYVPEAGISVVNIINTATNTVTGLVADPGPTFNLPFPMAVPPLPQGPRCLKGVAVKNVFLLQTDLVNVLSWCTPIVGSPIATYRIYRDSALTDLVTTLQAKPLMRYEDHNLKNNTTYTYYIVAIDIQGNASFPVTISVTQSC